jgi:peptidoglycan/LPS O-acetylase OafA/YrhL
MTDNQQSNILSRQQCSALKGIAILLVIIHNLCHRLNGIDIAENEFTYSLSNAQNMLDAILHPTTGLLSQLFTFIGPFGLYLFVFVSGYGLVKKYEQQPISTNFGKFMWHNATKLWRLLIPGSILFFLMRALLMGDIRTDIPSLVLQTSFFANLVPGSTIYPMIFWYLGMAMELYAIYWLILRRCNTATMLAITLAALLGHWLLLSGGDPTAIHYYNVNFMGWLTPFVCGIYIARHGFPKIASRYRWLVVIAMTALALVGQFNCYTWTLTCIGILYLAISFVKSLSQGWFQKSICWVGNISAIIYIIHPTTRGMFCKITPAVDSYHYIIAYIAVTLILSYLASKILLPRRKA